jgi:hypothetical protein
MKTISITLAIVIVLGLFSCKENRPANGLNEVYYSMVQELESEMDDSLLTRVSKSYDADKLGAVDEYAFNVNCAFCRLPKRELYDDLLETLFRDNSRQRTIFLTASLSSLRKNGKISFKDAVEETQLIQNLTGWKKSFEYDELVRDIAFRQDLLIHEGDAIAFDINTGIMFFAKRNLTYSRIYHLDEFDEENLVSIEGVLVEKLYNVEDSVMAYRDLKSISYVIQISKISRDDIWESDSLLKPGSKFTLYLSNFGLPIRRL